MSSLTHHLAEQTGSKREGLRLQTGDRTLDSFVFFLIGHLVRRYGHKLTAVLA